MYTISTTPYLDTHDRCYKKIITINTIPHETTELHKYIKTMRPRKEVSIYKSDFRRVSCCNQPTCINAFIHPNTGELLYMHDLPELFTLLTSHGYEIEPKVTKVLRNSNAYPSGFICMITPIII